MTESNDQTQVRQSTDGGIQKEPWVPLGHFYSPIVDICELDKRREQVFDRSKRPANIDLRDQHQLELIRKLKRHYDLLRFTEEPQADFRYYYDNGMFSYADGIVLACMLMELRPRRVVEFGSGYSSCVTIDVNEKHCNWGIDCTFIDPFPKSLLKLMKPGDSDRVTVLEKAAQDVDLDVIDRLEPGDVLFIDSTHVSKAGSDVNFHFFNILPRLKAGVYIHFHDVFYPFEYPSEWFFKENRSWNELYLLRAFLMNNPKYQIEFFSTFIFQEYREEVEALMPLFGRNPGGSIWLKKL